MRLVANGAIRYMNTSDKIRVDRALLKMRSLRGFVDRWIYHLINSEKQCTKLLAYHKTEDEYIQLFGQRRFTDYTKFCRAWYNMAHPLQRSEPEPMLVEVSLLRLATRSGFIDRFWWHVQRYYKGQYDGYQVSMTDVPVFNSDQQSGSDYAMAYEQTEHEHELVFHTRAYSGWDSFRQVLNRDTLRRGAG